MPHPVFVTHYDTNSSFFSMPATYHLLLTLHILEFIIGYLSLDMGWENLILVYKLYALYLLSGVDGILPPHCPVLQVHQLASVVTITNIHNK